MTRIDLIKLGVVALFVLVAYLVGVVTGLDWRREPPKGAR